MHRFTRQDAKGAPYFASGLEYDPQTQRGTGPAIHRLACFENAYEALEREGERVEGELARLREAGKQKTVQFKQLLAQKITNANLLSMFSIHGIKDA